MLLRDNGMPKIQIVTDEATIKKYGGNRMYFAPPRVYDELMNRVPPGKVITVGAMREYLARQNGADFTDPITAGIFVSIAAWASHQRAENRRPTGGPSRPTGSSIPNTPAASRPRGRSLKPRGTPSCRRGGKTSPILSRIIKRSCFPWTKPSCKREGLFQFGKAPPVFCNVTKLYLLCTADETLGW